MDGLSNKRRTNWGLLLIFLGIAASLNVLFGFDRWEMVAVFGVGFMATFAYYLTQRNDLLLAIPAYVLFALTVVTGMALVDLLVDEMIATVVLLLIAVPFLVVYLNNRTENWWALIPAYVMFAIGSMIFLIGVGLLINSWIAFYVLGAIAMPFLLIYVLNRSENWWALIPAYVMLVIGTMVVLIESRILLNLAIPGYIMFAIALPFIFVFLTNRSQRWALIPGGIMTVMGVGFFLGTDLGTYIVPAALILTGILVLSGSFKK